MRRIDPLLFVLIVLVFAGLATQDIGDPQPTQPTAAPMILPTQPAPVVFVPTIPQPAATWTPFVILPTNTQESRAGWEAPAESTGQTGNHDPGRSDRRSPNP